MHGEAHNPFRTEKDEIGLATDRATPERPRIREASILDAYQPENVSDLPREMQIKIWQVFEKQWSAIREDEQEIWMEQFLSYKIASPEQAIRVVRNMDDRVKRKLGQFVGRVLDADEYVGVFHVCWPSFISTREDWAEEREIRRTLRLAKMDKRRQQRRTLQQEFIDYFLDEDPSRAHFIAPFVDLTKQYMASVQTENGWKRVRTRAQYDRWSGQMKAVVESRKTTGIPPHKARSQKEEPGKKQNENFLNEYFGTEQQAEKLIDALLDESTLPTVHYERSHRIEEISKTVKWFCREHQSFMLSYLPRILELGIITQPEVKELFLSKVQYPKKDFYQTPEEKQQEEKLVEKAQERRADAAATDLLYDTAGDTRLAKAYLALQDAASKRAAVRTMRAWPIVRQMMDAEERAQYLTMLLDNRIPVFAVISMNDLSAETQHRLKQNVHQEGAALYSLSDLSDLAALVKDGQEELILTEILEDLINYGSDGVTIRSVIWHADRIIPCFREENQAKILHAIQQAAPGAWVKNVRYAIKHEQTDFNTLIETLGERPDIFMLSYHELLSEWQNQYRLGKETTDTLNKLQRTMRMMFESDPGWMIDYPHIAKSFFTEKQEEELMRRFIREATSSHHLASLIDRAQSEKRYAKYLSDIRAVLRSNVHLFGDFFAGYNRNKLSAVFAEQERIALVVKNIDVILKHELHAKNELLLLCANEPHALKKIHQKILNSEHPEVYLPLIQNAEEQLYRDAQRRKDVKDYRYTDKDKLATVVRQRLRKFYTDSLETYRERCEEDPMRYMHPEALRINGLPVEVVPEHIMKRAVHLEPDLIVDLLPRFRRRKDRETYGMDRMEPVVQARMRSMAFMTSGYGRWQIDERLLSEDSLEHIRKINPLLSLASQRELPKDFYEMAIERLNGNGFIELYTNEMERIAAQEQEKYGPRTNTEYFRPNQQFQACAEQCLLFDACPALRQNREAIVKLTSKQKKDLFPLFEFIARYQLDENLRFNLEAESIASVRQKCTARIGAYVAEIFNLEDFEGWPQSQIDQWAIQFVEKFNDVKAVQALMVYYGGACQKDANMRQAIRVYVRELVTGEISDWRAWDGRAPKNQQEKETRLTRFKRQQLIPEKLSLTQYENWVSDDEVNIQEMLQYDMRDIQSGVVNILHQALADQHVKTHDIKAPYELVMMRYEELTAPIMDINRRIKALSKKMEKQKKARKRGDETVYVTAEEQLEFEQKRDELKAYLDEHQEEMDKTKALLYLDRLRNITAHELETRAIKIDKTQIPFRQVFKMLEQLFSESHPDFGQDIQRLQQFVLDGFEKIFGDAKVSRADLTMTDHFDPGIYIRIGEEPVPSCQNFASSSSLSHGLLSYSMDPNVKMIQIFDDQGKIITRAALRLLEDKEGNPELFIERIYSTNAHHKINEAVINFAKQKAEQMGIELYAHTTEGYEKQGDMQFTDLESHNSRTPCVYTDAGGGRRPNGKYQIRRAMRIN